MIFIKILVVFFGMEEFGEKLKCKFEVYFIWEFFIFGFLKGLKKIIGIVYYINKLWYVF